MLFGIRFECRCNDTVARFYLINWYKSNYSKSFLKDVLLPLLIRFNWFETEASTHDMRLSIKGPAKKNKYIYFGLILENCLIWFKWKTRCYFRLFNQDVSQCSIPGQFSDRDLLKPDYLMKYNAKVKRKNFSFMQ